MNKLRAAAFILAGTVLAGGVGHGGVPSSGIANTKHNLSATSPLAPARSIRATTETQICVFCHTPHSGDTSNPWAPLWNRRQESASTYALYSSASYDATHIQTTANQPAGSSKLCLACHDGTLAIGQVNVYNRQIAATNPPGILINMTTVAGTGTGQTIPVGLGIGTGFTRNLGADLSNDHPISVTYTAALAIRDGEMRELDSAQNWPQGSAGSARVVGVREAGVRRPTIRLEPTGLDGAPDGQVQCASCHDPHVANSPTLGNMKFLRMNRLQQARPTSSAVAVGTDIVCLACHDKGKGATMVWQHSSHANSSSAIATYTLAAANLREFPHTSAQASLITTTVWNASCLNCHDMHTVVGARRLLREGVDAGSTAVPKVGGANTSAIEETCFQCHRPATATAASVYGSAVTSATRPPPDIWSDYRVAGGSTAVTGAVIRNMPITVLVGGAGTQELHNIGVNVGFDDGTNLDCLTTNTTNVCGADFIEKRTLLGGNEGAFPGTGVYDVTRRHAECTDCHNPHRVVPFRNGTRRDLSVNPTALTPIEYGTHRHTNDAALLDAVVYVHTNIISGALRGAWGVEPSGWATAGFNNSLDSLPNAFAAKRGDPSSDGTQPLIGILNCASTGQNNDTNHDGGAAAIVAFANTDRVACNAKTYVTREYQICMKCHSNYTYTDNNLPERLGNRPMLGVATPASHDAAGVPVAVNVGLTMQRYTNQAKEFQAPQEHRGKIALGKYTADASPGAALTGICFGDGGPNAASCAGGSGAFKGTPPNQLMSSYPIESYGVSDGNGDYRTNSVQVGMVDFQVNNHRSWHPVFDSTGRTAAVRSLNAARAFGPAMFNQPWQNGIGTQTMYCTDCHGNNTPGYTAGSPGVGGSIPTDGDTGQPWGPHGSGNNFILKGPWDRCTGFAAADFGGACMLGWDNDTNTPDITLGTGREVAATVGAGAESDLCFKCHNLAAYAGTSATFTSGFANPSDTVLNVHGVGQHSAFRCGWCHAAVPHGWKNKSLLINLNDVGPEVICRQQDSDDLSSAGGSTTTATGVANSQKCVVGQPMPPGTQMRNEPLPNPSVTGGANSGALIHWDGDMGTNRGYYNPPYYRNAMLKWTRFYPSGRWIADACGSVGNNGFPGRGNFGGVQCGSESASDNLPVEWMGSASQCAGTL